MTVSKPRPRAPNGKSVLQVPEAQNGFRADRALATLAEGLSRRASKLLFRAGLVHLNGRFADGSERIRTGDRIEYPGPGSPGGAELLARLQAPRLVTRHGRQVNRLYEDEHLLVLAKPAEIMVHRNPDGPTRRETLEDVLRRAYPRARIGASPPPAPESRDEHGLSGEKNGAPASPSSPEVRRPPRGTCGQDLRAAFHFVHRLDLETTGCLLVAKTEEARDRLMRDFQHRRVRKSYLAVAAGRVPWESKTVRRPITYVRGEASEEKVSAAPAWVARKMGRRPLRAKKRGVALEEGANEGKVCETRFRVLARYGRFTVLLCEPRTGRLHQIRVHLAAEGFPLAYDPLYGRRRALRRDEILPAGRDREADAAEVVLDRLPLHAWKLVFTHPATAERIEVQAPLPRDLTQFLRLLKKAK